MGKQKWRETSEKEEKKFRAMSTKRRRAGRGGGERKKKSPSCYLENVMSMFTKGFPGSGALVEQHTGGEGSDVRGRT